MDLLARFKNLYPEAWDKIVNDDAFEEQTEVRIETTGGYRKCDSTAEAISAFLESVTDDGTDPKDILNIFFRLNKRLGKIADIGDGCTANMAIMSSSFIETAKVGLSYSSSSLERSPAFQDVWERTTTHELLTGESEKVVADIWSHFCAGTNIRWCFEIQKDGVDSANAHCLNCRLSLGDYSKGKRHLLFELSPTNLSKPTALDAGSNLYDYWIAGGKTLVRDGCETLDATGGLPEFVFQPAEGEFVKLVCTYFPCRNFARP